MKRPKKEKNFIKKPIYVGGLQAMRKFIADHLVYPEAALKNRIEGTVSIKYTIDHLGKVIHAKAISTLGHGCEAEAERLVKLLRFQTPKNRNVKVQFHKNIQIHFRLPKARTPSPAQVNYVYQPTKAPTVETKKANSYFYTTKLF